MCKKLASILCALLLLSCCLEATASTIAIFPMEELTYGPNGVSFELRKLVAAELGDTGIDIISETVVDSFLARNRIRMLGLVETSDLMLAKNEIDADLVLYGSIFEKQHEPLAISVTLYLVRTGDSRIIWSNSSALSLADTKHLLGISEPQSREELLPIVIGRAMSTFPKRLDAVAEEETFFNIDEAVLAPKYIRPGEAVTCSVKLNTSEVTISKLGKPQIFVKARNRVFVANESPDKLFYKATWTGSDGTLLSSANTEEARVKLAMAVPDPSLYEAVLTGEKDGRYPVTLVLSWPSGAKKVAFLGSYYVDSAPPEMFADLKGYKLHGLTTFKDRLAIVPHMKHREPLSSWSITISDKEGKVVRSQKGRTNLPLQFIWNGRNAKGKYASDGVYTVTISALDRAKNQASLTEQVRLARTAPAVDVEVKPSDGGMVVGFQNKGDIPVTYWRLEMRSNGAPVKELEGEKLPVSVEVPMVSEPQADQLDCLLEVRDILGNEVKRDLKDFFTLASRTQGNSAAEKSETEKGEPAQNNWSTEF